MTGTTWPRPAYRLLVTGICRIWVDRLLQQAPFPLATVTAMEIPQVTVLCIQYMYLRGGNAGFCVPNQGIELKVSYKKW